MEAPCFQAPGAAAVAAAGVPSPACPPGAGNPRGPLAHPFGFHSGAAACERQAAGAAAQGAAAGGAHAMAQGAGSVHGHAHSVMADARHGTAAPAGGPALGAPGTGVRAAPGAPAGGAAQGAAGVQVPDGAAAQVPVDAGAAAGALVRALRRSTGDAVAIIGGLLSFSSRLKWISFRSSLTWMF